MSHISFFHKIVNFFLLQHQNQIQYQNKLIFKLNKEITKKTKEMMTAMKDGNAKDEDKEYQTEKIGKCAGGRAKKMKKGVQRKGGNALMYCHSFLIPP